MKRGIKWFLYIESFWVIIGIIFCLIFIYLWNTSDDFRNLTHYTVMDYLGLTLTMFTLALPIISFAIIYFILNRGNKNLRIKKPHISINKQIEYNKLPNIEYREAKDIRTEKKRSRRIPNDVLAEVMRRSQGKCEICGAVENLHIDHIIPFSRGGSNDPNNLQILCRECNLKKGNLRSL